MGSTVDVLSEQPWGKTYYERRKGWCYSFFDGNSKTPVDIYAQFKLIPDSPGSYWFRGDIVVFGDGYHNNFLRRHDWRKWFMKKEDYLNSLHNDKNVVRNETIPLYARTEYGMIVARYKWIKDKVWKVFYDYGMADKDCLSCHDNPEIKSSVDGRSLFVNYTDLKGSRHDNIACSQCHSEVNVSKHRPCETITQKVDCTSCHAEVGVEYAKSTHGTLFANNDNNAPTCKECHGTHGILGKLNPQSPTFATNIPTLCARCHREGEKAAVRYTGTEKDIIKHYTESIHGKGLLKSGLTVTATCTDCHTAHMELPHTNPESSINPKNVAETCGKCHHGIEEQFVKSIHSPLISDTDKQLPGCADCHSAHTIKRTDAEGFKLEIMDQCGRCHEKIAATYFDTYHGKVSQLGYTKTAKCYDCHGAHDILPPTDPRSRLSRDNVVNTCKTCHPSANRQFAGYLTHATHHDPDKYPFLFWTFWGMTGLLIGTFFIAGLHTLLWLPRSLQWRRKLKSMHIEEETFPDENQTEESEGENT